MSEQVEVILSEVDEAQQDRVIALADEMLKVLAGRDTAEGRTALMITVVSTIVSAVDRGYWQLALAGFSEGLQQTMQRPDVVEWIQAHVRPDRSKQ